jgi:hypothetical protein
MSNNKQQTTVDWIEQEMLKGNLSLKEILEKAKEIEKKQIEEAFINGHKDGWNFGRGETQQFFLAAIYYYETYGGNK